MGAESRRPTVFLASSTEASSVMRDIALLVERAGGVPRQWTESFQVGSFTLESLLEASRSVDAALIIASPDDSGVVRGESYFVPRGNVLVELGIFLRALGPKKAALVYVEKDGCELRLPSDLNGLTHLAYNESTPLENERRVGNWLRSIGASRSVTEMLPPPEDARYQWDHVSSGIQLLVRKMAEDHYEPDAVLGLGRSGGIVGGLIASLLGSIPLGLLDLKYSEGKHELQVHFRKEHINIPADAKRVLVVEGATTGGITPSKAKRLLEDLFPDIEFRFAFLIRLETSQFRGDYVAYVQSKPIESLPWHGPKSVTVLKFPDRSSSPGPKPEDDDHL